uniref:HTH_Tnp_Tc3_1 domain-containing protein n=1 Tax=Heterorhabditis bacteriophora TaxID=37862 RepID=A0A1I7XLY3_HETBA
MGRASTLALHERGQMKAPSTAGHSVKQIADVVKHSRKAIINFLRHQEEYESTVWRMLDKCPNIVRSRMKKWPQLTQGHKDERLCWARIFMRCNWEKDLRHFSIGNFDGGSVMIWGSFSSMGLIGNNEQHELPKYLRTSSSPVSPTFSRRRIHFSTI